MARAKTTQAKTATANKRAAKPVGNLPMTARTLRALAFEFLRYECGCYMVSFERSPLDSKPDVLGLDKHRRLFELEIKISKSDFDRDAKKPHRQRLMKELEKSRPNAHNYLAYLVPLELVEHVREHAPSYAGILTVNVARTSAFTGFPQLEVLRPPVRLHDNRLSMRHCAIMARDMSGTLASLLRDDVKEHMRRDELENQVVALGGSLPKFSRVRKNALAPKVTVKASGRSRINDVKKAVKASAKLKKGRKRRGARSSLEKSPARDVIKVLNKRDGEETLKSTLKKSKLKAKASTKSVGIGSWDDMDFDAFDHLPSKSSMLSKPRRAKRVAKKTKKKKASKKRKA